MELVNIFTLSFNMFSSFPVENMNKSDDIDKDVVEKLLICGLLPKKVEYLQIISNQSNEWKEQFKEYLNDRVENVDWFKTLFTKTEVENELDSILLMKTILHYATVELKMIDGETEIYLPNEELFAISDDKKEYLQENIKLFDLITFEEFFKRFADRIINARKPIDYAEKLLLEKYKNKLEKYFEDANIYFKENKLILISLGYKFKKLSMEDIIRFFNMQIIGKPLAIYTKELKRIKNSDVISDCVKDKILQMIENVYENNKENVLKLFKQKRKLIKKMLSVCGFKEKKDKMKYGKEIYELMYNNKNIQKIKSDYSLLKEGIVSKPVMIKENFDYSFRNLDNKLIVENLLKLPISTQVQTLNYIRKIKNKIEFVEKEQKEYYYILPHTYFTGEMKIDIEYYKSNLERLNEIENALFENIKNNVYEYLKKNNIKIHKNALKDDLKLAFPYSLRMENSNDFYFEKGSYLEMNELRNLRVGIYWENVDEKSVDLDLNSVHMDENENYYQLGWNSSMRVFEDDLKMIYSGDIRDGKNGAAEFIEIKNNDKLKYSILSVSDFHKIQDAWYYAGISIFDDSEDVKKYNGNIDEILFNFNPDKLVFSFKNIFKENKHTHVIFVIDYDNKRVYPTCLVDKDNVLKKSLFKNYLHRILVEKDNLKINEVVADEFIINDSYFKEDEVDEKDKEKIILNASELVYELFSIND